MSLDLISALHHLSSRPQQVMCGSCAQHPPPPPPPPNLPFRLSAEGSTGGHRGADNGLNTAAPTAMLLWKQEELIDDRASDDRLKNSKVAYKSFR